MKTVTVDIHPLGDTLKDLVQAWDAGEAFGLRISFETPTLKVLSAKRWGVAQGHDRRRVNHGPRGRPACGP